MAVTIPPMFRVPGWSQTTEPARLQLEDRSRETDEFRRQQQRPEEADAQARGQFIADAETLRRVEAASESRRSEQERILEREQTLTRSSRQALQTLQEVARAGEEEVLQPLVGIDIRV